MNWNEFYKAISGDQLKPVYLFVGPEEYIKREALQNLRQKLLPPGLEALNEVTLEGVTAQQITDAAETMPMMCERRIVVVRDWAPLMANKSKNEDDEVAWMRKWLENPPGSCVLVFYMRGEMDKRKKMSALLAQKAETVSFEFLSDAELSKWANKRLKPQGKKIAANAMNTLTYMAGRELTRLCGELDKLSAYVGEQRGEIVADDVRAVVSASLEYNVFELLNHLLAGDMQKAQALVNSLLQGGQTAIGLLSMLTRQIRQMAHMKCALDAGTPVPVVQEQLKLHPYAAKRIAQQCQRLSADWLTRLYETCVGTDYAVKSGSLRDRSAMDSIILKIGLAARGNK